MVFGSTLQIVTFKHFSELVYWQHQGLRFKTFSVEIKVPNTLWKLKIIIGILTTDYLSRAVEVFYHSQIIFNLVSEHLHHRLRPSIETLTITRVKVICCIILKISFDSIILRQRSVLNNLLLLLLVIVYNWIIPGKFALSVRENCFHLIGPIYSCAAICVDGICGSSFICCIAGFNKRIFYSVLFCLPFMLILYHNDRIFINILLVCYFVLLLYHFKL